MESKPRGVNFTSALWSGIFVSHSRFVMISSYNYLYWICRKRGIVIDWKSLCKNKKAWTTINKEVVEIHTKSLDWIHVSIPLIIITINIMITARQDLTQNLVCRRVLQSGCPHAIQYVQHGCGSFEEDLLQTWNLQSPLGGYALLQITTTTICSRCNYLLQQKFVTTATTTTTTIIMITNLITKHKSAGGKDEQYDTTNQRISWFLSQTGTLLGKWWVHGGFLKAV